MRAGEMRAIGLALALVVIMLTGGAAWAADDTVIFAGATFAKKHEARNGPNAIVEFTSDGESIEAWTRLFAFHAFTATTDDPVRAARRLGALVKQRNPAAKFSVIKSNTGPEVIIDFLTWPPDDSTLEFNVFKYGPAAKGLVAAQFARRFKLGDMSADKVKAMRHEMLEAMAKFDLGQARARLGAEK